MQDLKITLIQSALHWENAQANLRHFEVILRGLKNSTHLIVLPEMFSTGFSMNAAMLSEEMNGATLQWMRHWAQETNAVITGSVIIREEEKFFNRLIWMQPDGSHEHYDKRHLFGLGDEHTHYSAGNKKITPALNGWSICPLVCYDLRFPVWCRNSPRTADTSQQPDGEKESVNGGQRTADFRYDLLLFVANWPERRNFAWKHLLQARAIENQCYVAGVNRIGTDGNGIYYSGDSAVIDPLGEVIFTQADTACVKTFTLNSERLQLIRKNMPFLGDADAFRILS